MNISRVFILPMGLFSAFIQTSFAMLDSEEKSPVGVDFIFQKYIEKAQLSDISNIDSNPFEVIQNNRIVINDNNIRNDLELKDNAFVIVSRINRNSKSPMVFKNIIMKDNSALLLEGFSLSQGGMLIGKESTLHIANGDYSHPDYIAANNLGQSYNYIKYISLYGTIYIYPHKPYTQTALNSLNSLHPLPPKPPRVATPLFNTKDYSTRKTGAVLTTYIDSLVMNSASRIDMRIYQPGIQFNKLILTMLNGEGSFSMNTSLANGVSDYIQVTRWARGHFKIRINDSGIGNGLSENIPLVEIAKNNNMPLNPDKADATFTLENQGGIVESGNWQYILEEQPGFAHTLWSLVKHRPSVSNEKGRAAISGPTSSVAQVNSTSRERPTNSTDNHQGLSDTPAILSPEITTPVQRKEQYPIDHQERGTDPTSTAILAGGEPIPLVVSPPQSIANAPAILSEHFPHKPPPELDNALKDQHIQAQINTRQSPLRGESPSNLKEPQNILGPHQRDIIDEKGQPFRDKKKRYPDQQTKPNAGHPKQMTYAKNRPQGRTLLSQSANAVLNMADTTQHILQTEIPIFEQRIMATKHAGPLAVWSRYLQETTQGENRYHNALSSLQSGMQLGGDYTWPRISDKISVGLFFTKSRTGITSVPLTSGQIANTGGGMYGTWQHNNGLFVDGVFTLMFPIHTINTAMYNGQSVKGRYQQRGISATLGSGWSTTLYKHLQIIPYGRLTYIDLSRVNYTLDNHMHINLSRATHWQGEFGLSLKSDSLVAGGKIKPYLSLAMIYRKSNSPMMINQEDFNRQDHQYMMKYSAGVTLNITKDTLAYADLGYQRGPITNIPSVMNMGFKLFF